MASFITAPVTHTILPNGLTVILAPMQTPSTTVLAMVGVGSRYEGEQVYGVSHFLEHLVFKGTKKYPDAFSLSSVVDSIGAEWNAFTSKEYTGFYIKSASEYVSLSLDVVSDMLLAARLLPTDIEREKSVIVEELHMYEDIPARHLSSVFERTLYAGSGLGHDIIGKKETIEAMRPTDLTAHVKKWYGLSNMVLVVAGDQSVVNTTIVKEVEKQFAKQHATREKLHSKEIIATLQTPPNRHSNAHVLVDKNTQQTHCILGFEGLQRKDPDRYAAAVLGTLLGGTMSSRLFTEVREKRGLCYYVHSDDDSYHDRGFFGASAGVDQRKLLEALRVIIEQLRQVAQPGPHEITQAEVSNAKNHLIGSTILHLEDSMAIAQFYAGRKLLRDELYSPGEEIERYKEVTLEHVRAVAKRLCGNSLMHYSVLGPHLDEAAIAATLNAA